MSDMTDLLNQEADLNTALQDFVAQNGNGLPNQDAAKEDLIAAIEPFSVQLEQKMVQIEELQGRLKILSAEAADLEEKIKGIWEPFIKGTSKAELVLSTGRRIEAKTGVSVSQENADESTNWFLSNGYKDVMKYQIHYQTMQRIAREHYDKGESIPGLKYFNFTKIKIK